jgi:NAD+ kinase
MPKEPKTIQFFLREDNSDAVKWREKLRQLITDQKKKEVSKNADLLVILGGDGTILEAARRFQDQHSTVLGLNLGTLGFLASIRDAKDFEQGFLAVLKGEYRSHDRMMLQAEVMRDGKSLFKVQAMNEIVVQNVLGMVELKVHIEGHPFQTIRGSGVLISTATGSTAYNLSAHGPVLMPDIKGMVVTELLDHNIPTPSLVIKEDRSIKVRVVSFRERGILTMTETGEPVDVLLLADTETTFPLKEGDEIIIEKSPYLITFAEIEPSYFFKSLSQKFDFD